MGTSQFLGLLFLSVSVLSDPGLAAKPASPSSSLPQDLLPKAFGGWQLSKSPQITTDPAAADPVNAALLTEYGFTCLDSATYTRDDGRRLTVKAARFRDATGAYGAFTFYRIAQMQDEKIGDQGSSLNERVLFFRGNILVDTVFQHFSAMSAAELRELANDLPKPPGSDANLPGLAAYLPKRSSVKNTSKYLVGPIGLAKTGSPLPAQYVDFSKGAEVVLGDYNISGATGRLMVIGYPTPQIAAAQLKQIESAQQAHQFEESQGAHSQMMARRTGPLVLLASGQLPAGEAKALLSSVNYDADVTWNENTYFTRRDNAANLIVGVILLAAIICGLSLVAGVVFGGFRVAVKRLLPGRVFDRPEQLEIIALNLSERVSKPGDSGVSSSIEAG
jgi:hypothetical protein